MFSTTTSIEASVYRVVIAVNALLSFGSKVNIEFVIFIEVAAIVISSALVIRVLPRMSALIVGKVVAAI